VLLKSVKVGSDRFKSIFPEGKSTRFGIQFCYSEVKFLIDSFFSFFFKVAFYACFLQRLPIVKVYQLCKCIMFDRLSFLKVYQV